MGGPFGNGVELALGIRRTYWEVAAIEYNCMKLETDSQIGNAVHVFATS